MSLLYTSPIVTNSIPYWEFINDIIQGGEGIKSRGEAYLPKEASENKTSYATRLARSTFLDSYNPTVDGISGLIFKNPIVYGDDIPTQLNPFIENADMQGNHFDILLEDLFKTALHKGISFALMDAPNTEAPKSRAEEIKKGIKPYAVIIQPENVEAWKTETINGQIVLTMVKIKETAEVDDPSNIYATKIVERRRVLYRGSWQLWEMGDNGDVLVGEGNTNLDHIPLFALNLNARGFFSSFPTFYDLGKLNVDHYQIFSDSRHSAHTASVPFFWCRYKFRGRTRLSDKPEYFF